MLKIKDMIDVVFSHNCLVKIWKRENENYSSMVWKGVAWEIPEEYHENTAMIFAALVENVWESDYLNLELKDEQ